MRIEITKINRWYGADLKDLPGSPQLGAGETPEEAVASLFYSILMNREGIDWVKHIDFTSLEVISVE
jgi:hypothetical protein